MLETLATIAVTSLATFAAGNYAGRGGGERNEANRIAVGLLLQARIDPEFRRVVSDIRHTEGERFARLRKYL